MSRLTPAGGRKRRKDIQKRNCLYCGAPGPSTIDHFIPRALGGSNELENLVPACTPCNQRKADMHGYDWMEMLQKERRGLA